MRSQIFGAVTLVVLIALPNVSAAGGSAGPGSVSWQSKQSASVADSGFDLSGIVEGFLSGIADFFSSEEIDAAVALAEWAATSAFDKSAVRILGRGLDFYSTAEKAVDISLALNDLSNALKKRNRQHVANFFSEDKSAEQIAEEIHGNVHISFTDQNLVMELRSKGLTEEEIEKTYITMLVMTYAKEQGY